MLPQNSAYYAQQQQPTAPQMRGYYGQPVQPVNYAATAPTQQNHYAPHNEMLNAMPQNDVGPAAECQFALSADLTRRLQGATNRKGVVEVRYSLCFFLLHVHACYRYKLVSSSWRQSRRNTIYGHTRSKIV